MSSCNSAPGEGPRPPVILANGIGVNSVALLVELHARGEAPDMVLNAEMDEKPETLDYLALLEDWMDQRGIAHARCLYVPKRFKHWPPYFSLLENCLTNATLLSISMGGHSCSLKWKVAAQDRWVAAWAPAHAAWARGQRVMKLIGYDASPADGRRYAHVETMISPLYDYSYPLREWGWDRDACIARIPRAGLPVPVKSSCFFCAAMKPDEVMALPRWCLRLIVLMEARAAPRLRNIEGFWRKSTSKRPGSMTLFIRHHQLLDADEIEAIIAGAPVDLVDFQSVAAAIPLDERPTMRQWVDRFNDAVRQIPNDGGTRIAA